MRRAPDAPRSTPAGSPLATPTTEELVNSLGPADLQSVITLLKSNFTDPDAITDTELNRAAVEGFIARVEPFFQENGFYEKEIARRTEQFGNIAHVWSTYESRHHEDDPEPFMRGINSIQLFNDGKRWWIVSIYWQQESADAPIPEKYL